MLCHHSGPQSGESRYSRDTGRLKLVVVCDDCGAICCEFDELEYRPRARRFVGHLAELTARELGFDDIRIARVRLAAMVCDVGRDQIPPEILNKRGPLTPSEWTLVRRQPEVGAAVLSDASFDDLRDWVLARRERPDGNGYPRGLRGEEIPAEARILAVAEAYVAMTSERAHAAMRDHRGAALELQRCAGRQFDARIVDAFVSVADRRLAQVSPTVA